MELANHTGRVHELGLIPEDIAEGLIPGGSAAYRRVQPGRADGVRPERMRDEREADQRQAKQQA